MSSQKDIFSTLKSLGGLRLGFHYIETTLNDVTTCLGLNATRDFCRNAANSNVRLKYYAFPKAFCFQVYVKTVSVLFQGIPNITLVPLYDETGGVWQSERNAFNGLLSHFGHDIDAMLTTWSEKIA